jgi:hypothetical protein
VPGFSMIFARPECAVISPGIGSYGCAGMGFTQQFRALKMSRQSPE